MKKILFVALIFVLFTFFIIENKKEEDKALVIADKEEVISTEKEMRAIFVSYIENEKYLLGKTSKQQQDNLISMLDNLEKLGFNTLIFHVRSFSDAMYASSIFPWSASISGVEGKKPDFDILKFVVEQAHKRNIEVHAWINPYRVRNTTDVSSISEKNPAYRWLNTSNVKVIDGKGIFYNPASKEVRDLIVQGVKEIISNYNIDGIHFDDYFYPDKEIDIIEYLEYQNDGGTMTLDEFRLDNVNKMVKEVYDAIKEKDKSILFGISPEGNIDNNYDNNYADTKKWMAESGYVDYLMPQIYFGFENERRPFIETVTMWNDLITADNVSLIPALAFYKVGIMDENALSGKNEWIENDDIIKKEILVSRNLDNYNGFSLFRYDYVFNEEVYTETSMKEVENLKELLGN